MIFARRLLAGALALLLTGACAQAAPPAPSSPETELSLEEINTRSAPAPTLAEAYGSVSPHQVGELRVPKGKGPFPVAMLVHGGCWVARLGSVSNLRPLAVWLAGHGVATWNVDYRELGSGGGWPGTFADWAAAQAHLKDLAKRYPLDLSRLTVIGHSAGVSAGAWLAAGQVADGPIGVADLMPVRSIVALDGPLSLRPFIGADAKICGRSVIQPLFGGSPEAVPARYAAIDPLHHPPRVKAITVVTAALPSQDPALMTALRRRGIALTGIRTPDPWHFQLLVPGTRDFAAIAPALLAATGGR